MGAPTPTPPPPPPQAGTELQSPPTRLPALPTRHLLPPTASPGIYLKFLRGMPGQQEDEFDKILSRNIFKCFPSLIFFYNNI